MSSTLTAIARLLVLGLIAIIASVGVLAYTGTLSTPAIDRALQQLSLNTVSWNPASSNESSIDGPWPPLVGQPYPDLQLCDQRGQTVRLSDFAGKVILLELAAIPCKGCQAFAGGNRCGGFAGVEVQSNLGSIHQYARQYGGVTLGENKDLVFVQLLLYGRAMGSPTPQEVTGWANHFDMDRDAGEIVLQGSDAMLSRATYQMIPGFHLIDRDFVLQYDSSGHHPSCDLYRELLPALGRMSR